MKRLLLLIMVSLILLSACAGGDSESNKSTSDLTSLLPEGATSATDSADISSEGAVTSVLSGTSAEDTQTPPPDTTTNMIFRFDQVDAFRPVYSHGSGADPSIDDRYKTLCLLFEKSYDPIIVLNFTSQAVNLDCFSYMKIGFRAACDGKRMEIFYTTAKSPDTSMDKLVAGEFVNNQYNELVWDMSSDPLWTTSLGIVRLDPTTATSAGDRMWIDYIAFFETKAEADAYHVTDAAKAINPDTTMEEDPVEPELPEDAPDNVVLRFDSAEKVSNFVKHGSGMTIGFDEDKKCLRIDYAESGDPLFVWYPSAGTVNVSMYPIIKIKLKSNTESGGIQIFYATSAAPTMTGGHTKTATYKSGMWNEIILDPSAQMDWADDLTILRFDPVAFASEGEFTLIEYIGFFPTIKAAEAYEPLTDEQKQENKVTENGGLELQPVPMAKPFTDLDGFDVLFIGNSYSQDTATYLYQIAKSYGQKDVFVGLAGRPGCSVTMHCESIRSNAANYEYYVTSNGTFTATSGHTLKYCLTARQWDMIVINAESSTYGLNLEYNDLQELLTFVETNKTNQNAKIIWLMTWADQQDAERQVLDLYYSGEQNRMYVMGLNTTLRHVATKVDVDMIVPLGTVFQNLRSSFLGDTLTRDGYHASLTTGRYALALAFYCSVTGADPAACTYYLSQDVTADSYTFLAVADAVKQAITHPYEKTLSAHPHINVGPYTDLDSFNVLFIGNSFSQDTATYLNQIATSYGQKNVYVAIAGRGGCTIDMHLSSIEAMQNNYDYYVFQGENVTSINGRTLIECLKERDWDIIVLNHGGGLYGMPSTYTRLQELVDFVRENKTNPDAKIVWLNSWADQQDDKRNVLAQYYNGDQMKMYIDTVYASINCVAPCTGMGMILPVGTAIQNLRTSFLGDTLTRDGYHAGLTTGRYALALTFYCAITGADPSACTYYLSKDVTEGSRIFQAVVEAVENAIKVPFAVTPSQLT